MKFSGKKYFEKTLKVTKNEGLTLSLEDTFFEKPQKSFCIFVLSKNTYFNFPKSGHSTI